MNTIQRIGVNVYRTWSINQRINFKSYWYSPYHGMRYVLNEADYNPEPYHRTSPFPLAWD